MKKPLPHRPLAALIAAQLLLSACSATAQPPQLWPRPRPEPEPSVQQPRQVAVQNMPNFEAPAATHCARPVTTREIPGQQPQWGYSRRHMDETLARGAPADASRGVPLPAPPPAPSVVAPATAALAARKSAESSAFADARDRAASPFAPLAQREAQRAPAHEAVTAGVVDDNADFTSYLAFRSRTRVAHRARDIRERYLLEVKDTRGRGIADAEVAVQGASGWWMWARTDAAGRVWVHPDAFDAGRSGRYDISVRKAGRTAWARLERGQKSSVEVMLDAPAAPQRARLDLVFLIDATGSMGDEIDKLKASLRQITAEVSRLPSQPDICFGLVAYRDRGDAFLVRTHDFTDDMDGFLRGALGPLRADGGGDYPEAMNEALHEAVHQLSWRGEGATRLVVLLADAPPHLDYGTPQYDDDMVAALGKGIKVFSVGASGLDKQGEYIQRQIAQYTGGRFVFLTYANASDPSSGPGRETTHDVRNYSVETLDRLVVRLVSEELGKLARPG